VRENTSESASMSEKRTPRGEMIHARVCVCALCVCVCVCVCACACVRARAWVSMRECHAWRRGRKQEEGREENNGERDRENEIEE